MNSTSIVLVHGFTNNPEDFSYWIEFLKIAGLKYETIPFEKNDTINKEISEYAKALDQTIKKITKKKEIILLGFSMGGLVIRYYLQNIYKREIKIKSVITVATPHNGTIYAAFGAVGGFVIDKILTYLSNRTLFDKPVMDTSLPQLAEGSPFILKLNEKTVKNKKLYEEIEVFNILLKNDNLVSPVGNGIFPFEAVVNFEIDSDINHNMVLKERGTEVILKNLIIPIIKEERRIRRKGPQTLQEWEERERKEKEKIRGY